MAPGRLRPQAFALSSSQMMAFPRGTEGSWGHTVGREWQVYGGGVLSFFGRCWCY